MKAPFTALACLFLTGPALAHEYPTVDRVEYVLECLKNNGGSQEYIYKCSCAIDAISRQLDYDDYVEGATVARYQGMGGERMGVFRDADSAKDSAKRYRTTLTVAKKECSVPR